MSAQFNLNKPLIEDRVKPASKKGGKIKPFTVERKLINPDPYIVQNMPKWLGWKDFNNYKNISIAENAVVLNSRKYPQYEYRVKEKG